MRIDEMKEISLEELEDMVDDYNGELVDKEDTITLEEMANIEGLVVIDFTGASG